MNPTERSLKKIENELSRQAAAFVKLSHRGECYDHNLSSILLRLSGQQIGELPSCQQIQSTIGRIEKELFLERKKARMKRVDYDVNRHIALHQAAKALRGLDTNVAMMPQTIKGR